MIRFAIALALATLACGRSKGVPDDQLGSLVIEPKPPAKIDVALAQKDPEELARALASGHATVIAALGPHAVVIDSRTVVEEAGKVTDDMTEHTELSLGEAGSFHAVYANSADYGREAIFLGNRLYLRPRYQRWHGRAPETTEEPAQLRDTFYSAIAAAWDLVAPGAELTDLGAVEIAGRAGRKIAVKLSPTPRPNAQEAISQRRWREARTIKALAGEIVLDASTGMPLAVRFSGAIGFVRDGRQFAMKLEVDAKLTKLGVTPITAPADSEVVATPERKREVDERDYLLEDIAPSIRKKQDGTTAPPSVKPNGDAPKPDDVKPPPKDDAKRAKSDDAKRSDEKRSKSDAKRDDAAKRSKSDDDKRKSDAKRSKSDDDKRKSDDEKRDDAAKRSTSDDAQVEP
jgi:hypothetical protein